MKPLNIVFYASAKPREIVLAKALAEGCKRHGDKVEIRWTSDYGEDDQENDLKYAGPSSDTDVACSFGVKGKSLRIICDHLAVNKSTLLFDKGYTRQKGNDETGHTKYSRISVNAGDPSAYMMLIKRPGDRWRKTEVTPSEGRTESRNGPILICGSSAKYHAFHRLEDPTRWAQTLVSRLVKLTHHHIVYRPKPSSKLPSVTGASYSGSNNSIRDALHGCHVMITYGSGASLDAIVSGVPVITLGVGIALPVSETILENVKKPFWPDDALRSRWFSAVGYCQWTTEELRSGEAWSELKYEIIRQGKLS